MNPTIEKIIQHLFEDVEETEETRAIYDEIRTNCQERYSDARERGLSEDEAIHIVMESLSGMEEMLKPYASKARKADEDLDQEPVERVFDPARSPIREIRLSHMGSTDVKVYPADDSLVSVRCDDPSADFSLEDGVLLIEPRRWESGHMMGDITLSNLPEKISDMLGGLFRHVSLSLHGEAPLRVAIPAELAPVLRLDTASGDVDIGGLTFSEVQLGVASGDLLLHDVTALGAVRMASSSGDVQADGLRARELSLTTTSGDVRLTHGEITDQTRISSTSGDIAWTGSCPSAELNSISGDLRVDGTFEALRFKTVSGDPCITVRSTDLRDLTGQSTSGDIRVFLPVGLSACVTCHSTCGDIHQNVSSVTDAPARITLNTTSGDISIR